MAKKLITVLCYSAGVQSHAILKMVETGMIQQPDRFTLMAADPGMESEVSLMFRDVEARRICRERKIGLVIAGGPNLYRDLVELKSTKKTRLDTPPFWTDNGNGKEGKLIQKCTSHYKIQPINRAVRRELERLWAIPAGGKGNRMLAPKSVERWIGFTADEQDRADGLIKSKHQKYVTFRFPLIELGMTKSDVSALYHDRGWKIPIMSICNGCPFQGLRALKDKHDNRPRDWKQAVEVDDSIRDLTQIGVSNPCYVSKTLIPLRILAQMNFELEDPIENDIAQCTSGICFAS